MITVIGLGPMGRAAVRRFAAAGHAVTVWNRTPARAEGLDATRADTVAEAVAANELVVLSLTDYRVMFDLLEGVDLTGKAVVNLSSDTPGTARRAAEWVRERGGGFASGGIMVPAEVVGTEGSYVYCSGPEDLVRRFEPVLSLVGRVDYLGADPGLAQLHYQAQLHLFLTTLSAYLHTTALLKSAGFSAEEALPEVRAMLRTAEAVVESSIDNIDKDEHTDEGASVLMMAASATHVEGALAEAGLDTALAAAVRDQYDRALAAGHAKSGWTSLYGQLRR